jgi:hypothetical protein
MIEALRSELDRKTIIEDIVIISTRKTTMSILYVANRYGIMLLALIVPTVLLYTFFIRTYDASREIYNFLGVFNTHLFWSFPILATIVFCYLSRTGDQNVFSKAGSLCIANFVIMYAIVFAYAASTLNEYTLSGNIFEAEIAGFHVLMFVIGAFLCWRVGKKVIPKLFGHDSMNIQRQQ